MDIAPNRLFVFMPWTSLAVTLRKQGKRHISITYQTQHFELDSRKIPPSRQNINQLSINHLTHMLLRLQKGIRPNKAGGEKVNHTDPRQRADGRLYYQQYAVLNIQYILLFL
ncbi:hypothetical protein [Hymenobacter coalescens]